MKKLFLIFSCFMVSFVLFNCSSPNYLVSEKGDKAEVELKDGKDFSGEIVSISDTSIIFATANENSNTNPILFYSLIKDIKHIAIQGYSGSGWIAPVLIFQVLPAVLLAIASSIEGSNGVGVGVIFAIPAAITSLIFATTEGVTPQWDDSMPLDDIQNLKIYSRYRLGLSRTRMEFLLKMYKQKQIKIYN